MAFDDGHQPDSSSDTGGIRYRSKAVVVMLWKSLSTLRYHRWLTPWIRFHRTWVISRRNWKELFEDWYRMLEPAVRVQAGVDERQYYAAERLPTRFQVEDRWWAGPRVHQRASKSAGRPTSVKGQSQTSRTVACSLKDPLHKGEFARGSSRRWVRLEADMISEWLNTYFDRLKHLQLFVPACARTCFECIDRSMKLLSKKSDMKSMHDPWNKLHPELYIWVAALYWVLCQSVLLASVNSPYLKQYPVATLRKTILLLWRHGF
jgi:hypothetical protein